MSTNMPAAVDAFPAAATLSAHTLGTDPHSTLHGNLGDGLAATEAAVVALRVQVLNAQTGTTYTLVAGDITKLVTLSNAGAITLTVPQDSDATFAIGAWVEGFQLGAGQVTVVAGTGATLRATPGAKSRAQYSRFFLQKISANTWALSGDISA